MFVMPAKAGIQYLFFSGYRLSPCRYDSGTLDSRQKHAGMTYYFVIPEWAPNVCHAGEGRHPVFILFWIPAKPMPV